MNYLRESDEFASMVSKSNSLISETSSRVDTYKSRLQTAQSYLQTALDDKTRDKLLTSIADFGTEAGLKGAKAYVTNADSIAGKVFSRIDNTNVATSLRQKLSQPFKNKAKSIRDNLKPTDEDDPNPFKPSTETTPDETISFDGAGETGGTSESVVGSSVSETDTFGDAVANASSDVGDLASGLADTSAEGIAGGLEVVGDALDATGIGAVVGVGLDLAGVGLGIYGAIEGGESMFSWFKKNILHETPKADIGSPPPSVSSLSQNFGSIAVPTLDTASNLHSSVGAW